MYFLFKKNKLTLYIKKLNSMETIVIYPENKNQSDIIQAFLKEMKINFRSQNETYDDLEEWQKEMVEIGLNEVREGKTTYSSDVQEKAKKICM